MDQAQPKPRRKSSLKRRIRRWVSRPFLWLGRLLIPPIYCLYMWFVYVTSKVEHIDTDVLWWCRERYGGLVGIMWHQEVFMVAWAFRQYEGHTLASISDFGDLITGMLKLNGFIVFRGGSSRARTRKAKVLPQMIQHMQEFPGVAYGITCDGSKGPVYKVKDGTIKIAHACHKPMIVSRTWCKRRINLGGWDRAAIPLPFNHIVQAFAGPYFVPADADDPEVLERFRQHMENELLELTWWVHGRIGDTPSKPYFGFPEDWEPTWGAQPELPSYPFEPEPGHPALTQEKAVPVRKSAQRRQAAAVARLAAAGKI